MIKIHRNKAPQNTVMDQNKETELKKIRSTKYKGEQLNIKPLWKNKKIKDYLYKSQYGKCCYCEQIRGEGETDVEHFRPKAKVTENKKHTGYWWLAYEWDNLLIACKICNTQKGTRFPLRDENKRVFAEQDDIKTEEPFLINPLTENPEDFIEYDIPKNNTQPLMIKAVGKNEKGDKTVNELTGINSKTALLSRGYRLKSYSRLYRIFSLLKNDIEKREKVYEEIKKEVHSSNPFAGMARYYFNGPGKSLFLDF